MTKSQEKAVKKIRRLAEENMGEQGEIKEWDVDENEYFVSVVVETGRIGDEGTLASIFCRDRAQIFVGRRGGMRYPVSHKGKYKEKVFHGYSILEAVCDQRIL